jgi:hypothetical protein
MNYIHQYQELLEIKPDYYKLDMPFVKPSQKRFIFNVKELEFYRTQEFGVTGADESSPAQKIVCLTMDFESI